MVNKFGFDEVEWDEAKEQAKKVLVERARICGTIPYSELVTLIDAISLEAHDARLFHLLGEISTEEDAAGRGMLTAIVVHKDGDMQPGPGFFELAKELGRDTSNIALCWIDEVKKVYSAWGK